MTSRLSLMLLPLAGLNHITVRYPAGGAGTSYPLTLPETACDEPEDLGVLMAATLAAGIPGSPLSCSYSTSTHLFTIYTGAANFDILSWDASLKSWMGFTGTDMNTASAVSDVEPWPYLYPDRPLFDEVRMREVERKVAGTAGTTYRVRHVGQRSGFRWRLRLGLDEVDAWDTWMRHAMAGVPVTVCRDVTVVTPWAWTNMTGQSRGLLDVTRDPDGVKNAPTSTLYEHGLTLWETT